MSDLNSVAVSGKIVRDIDENDFRYIKDIAHLSTSVAVNKSVKKDGEWKNVASFFDVIIWGEPAKWAKEFCKKGVPVVIYGALEQQSWQSKDGKKNSKVVINASRIVQCVGAKKADGEDAPSKSKPQKSVPQYSANDFDDSDFDEDLLF